MAWSKNWRPGGVRVFEGKTAAPDANDDVNDGYLIGDVWIDETGDVSYKCLDNSAGAAVWAVDSAASYYRESVFTFNYSRITGQGAPSLVNRGIFFGFSLPVYNTDDEELFTCSCAPSDWDGTSDMIFYLGGWLPSANTSKKFQLQVSVETANYDGNATVPDTDNDIEVETTTGTWGTFTSFKIAFTVDVSAVGLAVGQPLAFRVRRIAATTAEITGEVVIEGAVLVYVANKPGGAV